MLERLDGYIRVSQVAGRSGERFQSPSQQRESIEGWAKAHGVTIAAWHEDLDRSGGTMDRPGMNTALARIQSGETGGLVVARLDRFARTVIGGLTVIKQLDEQGARVVSVAEQIDPATPMGRAMLGLLLIMAEWQRDQADEHLAAAQHRASLAGRFPGRTPYGYLRTDDGITEINPATAPVVQRIFDERASGIGWRTIAAGLHHDNIPTARGKQNWAASTLFALIRSEAYLGTFIGPRGLRIRDAWPPLVTQQQWNAANAVRGIDDRQRRHDDRLVAGIARCANCRSVLRRTTNQSGNVSYGCTIQTCAAKASITANMLDPIVRDDLQHRLSTIHVGPVTTDSEREGHRLRVALAAAQTELDLWVHDVDLRTVLGEQSWRAGMIERAAARDNASTDLAQHQATITLTSIPTGITGTLQDLPWEVERELVRVAYHSVWVRRSTVMGIGARQHASERVLLVAADQRDPPALPDGYSAEVLSPLTW